jgi:hypothetical protein
MPALPHRKTHNKEKKQGFIQDFEGHGKAEGRIHGSATEACQVLKTWQACKAARA